jgi:hypothetical protein
MTILPRRAAAPTVASRTAPFGHRYAPFDR